MLVSSNYPIISLLVWVTSCTSLCFTSALNSKQGYQYHLPVYLFIKVQSYSRVSAQPWTATDSWLYPAVSQPNMLHKRFTAPGFTYLPYLTQPTLANSSHNISVDPDVFHSLWLSYSNSQPSAPILIYQAKDGFGAKPPDPIKFQYYSMLQPHNILKSFWTDGLLKYEPVISSVTTNPLQRLIKHFYEAKPGFYFQDCDSWCLR